MKRDTHFNCLDYIGLCPRYICIENSVPEINRM